MNKAVFLDRDGVISKLVKRNNAFGCEIQVSPRKFEDFKLVQGVEEVLEDFKSKGFLNIIVTNQPDISRKLMEERELRHMHSFLKKKLSIDDIFVCPHSDEDYCDCRKPKSGLFYAAAKKWNINLSQSFMIGDSSGDLEAGHTAGCTSILVGKTMKITDFSYTNIDKLLEAKEIIK